MENQAKKAVRFVEVDENTEGQRLDNFLICQLKGVPKGHVYKIIRRGEVRVNKGRVKNLYRLKLGDLVRIPPVTVIERDPLEPDAWALRLVNKRVLHEDKDIIVLNKPSGIAVHGGSGVKYGIIDAMRALRPDERFLELVHRLDKATSGCLLIAKNKKTLKFFHTLFRTNKVSKTYSSLLCGVLHKSMVVVNAPLAKYSMDGGDRMVRVHPEGKPSQTTFKRERKFKNATLVSASPKTGRTHQIRVHAKHLGHPVAGDERYSTESQMKSFREKGLKRLFLHAKKISFEHPTSGQLVTFEAPLDDELEKFLDTL